MEKRTGGVMRNKTYSKGAIQCSKWICTDYEYNCEQINLRIHIKQINTMNVIEKISALETKVKSASAKQIIMWMVEALQNPVMEVDMTTFGSKVELTDKRTICVGCAATNFICKVGEIDPDEYIVDADQLGKDIGVDFEPIHEHGGVNLFTEIFEIAIDHLRQGEINSYNNIAKTYGFAVIRKPLSYEGSLHLIHTGNYTNTETLQDYIDLANAQE